MRVGLLIYGGLDTVSGGYLYDRKLVEYLEAQGDEVEIISLPWRNYGHHLLDNFSAALFHQLANLDCDVLLQDELNHPSLSWLNHRLRSKVKYSIVSIVHHLRGSELNSWYSRWLYEYVERRYLNSVDAFIYNSDTTRGVVERLITENKPGVVAYPAGDRLAPEISEANIRQRAHIPGPLRIVFLGNVIHRKGLHTLFNALKQLPDESWQLQVAGSLDTEVAYARLMQQMVDTHSWRKQVQFMGSLEDEQLVRLLTNSHVLVVPSSYEGFGIAYLEGMSFGLPAIGSKAGGAVEIIAHGGDGYLIAPGDVMSLAKHLRDLASDRDLLEKMSLAAHQRFFAHPGWHDSMGRIRAFLLELI
ncbi:MAG: glycosyltransferase family 1 protein [Chloroflexi bacterium]|nr:MAG: glycosyltransferase family 1 protein [Chloroflexota bacterium]MBL1193372.1 glycosyltransferase family 1 protein [Chloroflexota bacterium]NOH10664.1 glycosyltransferase family 4 protein [Chloroflexota bacterium]